MAPANYHMCVELNRTVSLSTEEDYNYSRPSIDLLLNTAAYVFKKHLVGIILSGANQDGAKGLRSIKKFGGTTVIQEVSECQVPVMPLTSKKLTQIDRELKTRAIIQFMIELHKNKRIQSYKREKN
ncbi:MAG: chemotaxis protein CheB [Bacteroidota bacterium]